MLSQHADASFEKTNVSNLVIICYDIWSYISDQIIWSFHIRNFNRKQSNSQCQLFESLVNCRSPYMKTFPPTGFAQVKYVLFDMLDTLENHTRIVVKVPMLFSTSPNGKTTEHQNQQRENSSKEHILPSCCTIFHIFYFFYCATSCIFVLAVVQLEIPPRHRLKYSTY